MLGVGALSRHWRPEPRRNGRNRVLAAPVIGVDEVEPDRGVLQTDLSGTWIANFDLLPLKDFGSTRLMESDGMNHMRPTLLFFAQGRI